MHIRKSAFQQMEKFTRWAVLPLLLSTLSACATPPPTTAHDKRPAGNAGVSMEDMSSDTWVFERSTDPMSGASGYSASIWSLGTVNLPFPYQGQQKLNLTVGLNPQGQGYAIVSIPRGQFTCYKCDIRIRFDSQPSSIWTANAVQGMTGFLSIAGENRFIEQAQHAKKVTIEVPFFEAGPKAVEFKTEGFPW